MYSAILPLPPSVCVFADRCRDSDTGLEDPSSVRVFARPIGSLRLLFGQLLSDDLSFEASPLWGANQRFEKLGIK
jgi:hypothetical protein